MTVFKRRYLGQLSIVLFISILAISFQNATVKRDPVKPPVAGGKCCVCYSGDEPAWQIPAFKVGCWKWLEKQEGCDNKIVKDMQAGGVYENPAFVDKYGACSVGDKIPPECKGKDVAVGYVGHWNQERNTQFIGSMTEQVCLDQSCNLYIHNTACEATKNAEDIQKYINRFRLPAGVSLVYKGSQCMSTGMLPSFGLCSKSSNQDCKITYGCAGPEYPSCDSTLGSRCESFQNGETSRCKRNNGSLQEAVCCTRQVTQTCGSKCFAGSMARWEKGSSCSQKQEPTCPPENNGLKSGSANLIPYPTPSPGGGSCTQFK